MAQSDGTLWFYANPQGIDVPLDVARSGVLDYLLEQVGAVAQVLAGADLPPPRSNSPARLDETQE